MSRRKMILDVSGDVGVVQALVPLTASLDQRHYVKLKYLHLPELPLLDAFTDAVEVNAEKFTVPAVNSVEALVDFLDSLYDSGSARVCYVWYSGHEFEICAGTQNVELSPAFAQLLKMPATLIAGQCYSSSLYAKTISVYSHFAIVVRGTKGMWNGTGFDEVIAKVRRDGVIDAHPHFFVNRTSELQVDVYAVTREGAVKEFTATEVWSLGLEYEEVA